MLHSSFPVVAICFQAPDYAEILPICCHLWQFFKKIRNAQNPHFHDTMGRSYPISVLTSPKRLIKTDHPAEVGFIGYLLLCRIGESPDPLTTILQHITFQHISPRAIYGTFFPIRSNASLPVIPTAYAYIVSSWMSIAASSS